MDPTLIITPFILLFMSNFPSSVKSSNCSITKCGGSDTPDIRFPFQVKDSKHPGSCGHPGFDVWCNGGSSETVLELPNAGNFSVKSIDYAAQELWVNDPNNCLPKKLLTLNLSGSPFAGVYNQEFSFYNCSSTLVTDNTTFKSLIMGPIHCLSGLDYFVYAILINNTTTSTTKTTTLLSPPTCFLIAPLVNVPVQWSPSLDNKTVSSSWFELNDDIRLSWFMPECRPCDLNGQMCSMGTNTSGFQVIICSNITNQGRRGKLSFTTFIAVILIICSPSIVCLVGSLYIWIRACLRHRSALTLLEHGSVVTQRPGHVVELGLAELNAEFAMHLAQLGHNDEAGPELQHAIVLSEIEDAGLSSSESENVCAICMANYRPRDRIGTLLTCGHYFHASCINKWLLPRRLHGRTCPICRAAVGS